MCIRDRYSSLAIWEAIGQTGQKPENTTEMPMARITKIISLSFISALHQHCVLLILWLKYLFIRCTLLWISYFIFSQPYFSNGRAIVIIAVRLFVTDVLWLNGARENLGCYWTLIGSRILACKWNENHRLWMTLKVTDNQYNRLS